MTSTEYGKMSSEMKLQIADKLGFGDVVRRDGDFGSVPARECGNMVKLAIQLAQEQLARSTGG